MMTQVLWMDHNLFDWIQNNLHGSFMDFYFVLFREKYFWLPFYVFLCTFIILKYQIRAYLIFTSCFLLILLTDQINSNILKKHFRRDRPCNELYFKDHYTSLIPCSGGFSFPSTHAANHSGLGVFLFLLLRHSFKKMKFLFLIWPILIGFSQIFVGVHFPLDVLVGLLVGGIIGIIVFFLAHSLDKKHFLGNTLLG